MKEVYIRAFIAGSSFPAIIWPFLYLGISFTFSPTADFPIGLIPLTIPILYGLVNILYFWIGKRCPIKDVNQRLLSTGALFGLGLSLYGNFVSNIPQELFKLTGAMQYITIPIAIIAYALIWRYIIKYINKLVGLKEW